VRIGIDASDMLAAHPTGIEHALIELVHHLAVVSREDEFVLYFNFVREACGTRFQERVAPLLHDGHVRAHVCRLPSLAMHMARRVLHLPIDWIIGACDVVHYPSFVMHPQRHGARVVTIHDLMPLTHPGHYPSSDCSDYWREVPKAVKRADAIVAVSHYTKAQIVGHFKVPEDRVAVVHHGVHARFRAATAEEVAAVRARYRLPSRYVLFVGSEETRKNVPLLIDAARIWRARGATDIAVVLAGKPSWGSGAIVKRVAACGLQGTVHRLGHIAGRDLPALYSGAEAFVLPSIAEGFGMPLLEAMACATPVIAADTTSLPEVVGDAGLLFDPYRAADLADCVARVAGDRALKERLIERGLTRAREFTWERAAYETLAVYRDAADRVRGSRRAARKSTDPAARRSPSPAPNNRRAPGRQALGAPTARAVSAVPPLGASGQAVHHCPHRAGGKVGPARLRIGVDARDLLVAQPTGVERMVSHFVRHLAAFTACDFVLFLDAQPPADLAAGTRHEVVIAPRRFGPLHALVDTWVTLQLPRLLREHRIDAFITLNTKFPIAGGVPAFATVHGVEWFFYPEGYRLVERIKQRAWFELCTRWCTGIITFTQNSRRDILHIRPSCRVPICVVPEGCDPVFRPSTADEAAIDVAARHGLDAPYILSVGSLVPRKNIDGLLRSYARLTAHLDLPHSLVLAGKPGWRANGLRELAGQLGVADRVRFLGFVPDADLVRLYQHAALFVYPSKYEGFGLPLLEAMSCGVPVVTADRSATAEVAGNAALLVDPFSVADLAQGLERALTDHELRAELISAGHARAAEHSWTRMTEEIGRFVLAEAARTAPWATRPS
jgi:glycosyltransferase involved in cell wall biosynthesis